MLFSNCLVKFLVVKLFDPRSPAALASQDGGVNNKCFLDISKKLSMNDVNSRLIVYEVYVPLASSTILLSCFFCSKR